MAEYEHLTIRWDDSYENVAIVEVHNIEGIPQARVHTYDPDIDRDMECVHDALQTARYTVEAYDHITRIGVYLVKGAKWDPIWGDLVEISEPTAL